MIPDCRVLPDFTRGSYHASGIYPIDRALPGELAYHMASPSRRTSVFMEDGIQVVLVIARVRPIIRRPVDLQGPELRVSHLVPGDIDIVYLSPDNGIHTLRLYNA